MQLHDLFTAPPDEWAWLHTKIDALDRHEAFVLDGVSLPAACAPNHCSLLFMRDGSDYSLAANPPEIRYAGPNRQMRELSRTGELRAGSWDEFRRMCRKLALADDARPGPNGPGHRHPGPGFPDPLEAAQAPREPARTAPPLPDIDELTDWSEIAVQERRQEAPAPPETGL